MIALSLSPVSAAVLAALNIPSVTSLVPGGIVDDVPETPTFPLVLFSVAEDRQLGGFGTKPGVGTLPEVRLRVHVFTKAQGFQTAQAVMDQVLLALADPPPVNGFSSWAIFHDTTTPVADQLIAGQTAQELVSDFRLYVELQ